MTIESERMRYTESMAPHFSSRIILLLSCATTLSICFSPHAHAKTRHFNFTITYATVTRLCNTKSLISVNGQFPGPTQYVREGDKVVVNVTNFVASNATIHWHGVRQLLSAWADGPAYITQCPIQPRESYVYRFQIVGQRGTLFWHAHYSWLRATVYGAFIILPKNISTYPFPKPNELPPLLLGEWWNADVESVIAQALVTGGAYNISNALTINGQPGDLYNCSSNGTIVYNVNKGKSYMLRVINAAINFQMYFVVQNHTLTVVEIDAEYTTPFTTDVILLAPGQTTSILLKPSTQTILDDGAQFYIAASVYSPPNASLVPFPTVPTTAILQYGCASCVIGSRSGSLALPTFPAANDTNFQANFTNNLRGIGFSRGFYYYDVPMEVDVSVLHTVGYNLQPCPLNANPNVNCQAPNATIFRSSISNITFVVPSNFNILQAYYQHVSANYTTNFPDVPEFQYNYTAVDPINKSGRPGTRVRVIPFNATVQVVYQNTATLFFESHPIHLHGQSFYVVGYGNGTFNPMVDTASFNLVNPPSRNTISLLPGGWAAIRFRAINPGAWFVHCHFDIHQTWGMDMAFVTQNGVGPSETLPPPPNDFPRC